MGQFKGTELDRERNRIEQVKEQNGTGKGTKWDRMGQGRNII